ncbi:MAG: hypothetical protein IJ703_06885 [Eubacterium sp.]|nr:hypothetical protein [Eubacterium sp.]
MKNGPMFCKYCGRQLNPNSKFCPSCGKKSNSKTGLAVGLTLGSVLLISAVIIIFALASKKDDKKSGNVDGKDLVAFGFTKEDQELDKEYDAYNDEVESEYELLREGGTLLETTEEGEVTDEAAEELTEAPQWIFMSDYESDYEPTDDDETESVEDAYNRDENGNIFNTLIGNSKEQYLQPTEYMNIDIPENAFYGDREVTVSQLPFDDLPQYEQRMFEEIDFSGTILDAFDINAGMGADENMPGEYTVKYDLAAAGIPEDMWEAVTAFRLDVDGYWQEYVTWLDGSNLCLESSQNSVLFYVVSAYVGYVIVDEIVPAIASAGWKRFFGIEDYIYVCEGGKRYTKKLFRIKYTYSATVGEMLERKKIIETDTRNSVKAKQAREAVAADEGITDPKDMENLDGAKVAAKREYLINKKLEANEDYVKLCEQIKQANDNPNATVEMVKKIASLLLIAHDYVKDEVKVKLPKYVMDVKLSAYVAEDAKGVTVAGILKQAYMYVNTSYLASNPIGAYDDLLLTITHEYFHACQRRYKCSRLSNLKFDEATANMVEEDCREYYDSKGYLSHRPGIENGNHWEMYALPLDSYSVTYPDHSKSFRKSDWSDTGYPLCHFVRYLMTRYNKSYSDVLEAYGSFYLKPEFSEIMKTAFNLTDEAMDTQYVLFARKNQAKWYETSKQMNETYTTSNVWAYPYNGISQQNGYKVEMNDHDYTTRVRNLYGTVADDYFGDVSMLIVFDKDFKESLPDTKVYPVGDAKTTNCKYGIFFHPRDTLHQNDFYLLEVDGGTSDKKGKSGYTVWSMEAPEEMDSQVDDGILQFILPKKSDTAKAGYIDGYRVTITASDGTRTVKYYKIEGSEKEIGIRVSKLINEKTKPEEASFELTVCEFIRNGPSQKLFGPESESRKSSMEAAMNETLAQMGAEDGVITISLGWQSDDDLDLHVVTPDGSEIYYMNKIAGGGELDVDMQVEDDHLVANPAEHVVFKNPDKGVYKISVVNYKDRTEGSDTPFIVVVKAGNVSKTFRLSTTSHSVSVVSLKYGVGDESGAEFETD